MHLEKNSRLADFIIIGGGIIGLSLARDLKKSFPDASMIVIEKEHACGWHASGRNSGVLHAGFYYTPDSLKARFTCTGNQLLTAYCEEKNIPMNKCGKLVVAKNEQDLAGLDELLRRGRDNGVKLYDITEQEAREIEPRVKTYERAIFSPTTASVNPKHVLQALQHDAEQEGIMIHTGVSYLKHLQRNLIMTTAGRYQAGYLINAAGLYADKIARDFDRSRDYRILPFKGLYLYSNEPPHSLRTNIYPVPDLKNPFLGVHFTVTADGKTKIGPTAIPAFWREQYRLLERFRTSEFIDIIRRQMGLLLFSEFDFKKLAWDELKKYSRTRLVNLAAALAHGVKKDAYTQFGQPGMRAQLLNVKTKKLEMDFILEGDSQSMHILNAVSPGFTSALPFASYVGDAIRGMLA